jgi:hypothetical protein
MTPKVAGCQASTRLCVGAPAAWQESESVASRCGVFRWVHASQRQRLVRLGSINHCFYLARTAFPDLSTVEPTHPF